MFSRRNKQKQNNLTYSHYYYANRAVPARPVRKKHRGFYKVAFTLIIVLILYMVWGMTFGQKHDDENDEGTPASVQIPITTKKPTLKESLQLADYTNTVQGVINANPAITIEVATIELADNTKLQLGSNMPLEAASVQKVLTAVDFLRRVEEGNESLDETVNGNNAQYELQQMIVVSNDNAWNAFINDLSFAQEQTYANQLGITDYNAVNNTLTAGDIANLFAALYEGKLLNASDTSLLLSYLKEANYRQYIVPVVPAGDTIYHKVGFYMDNLNDAAIITNGKSTFVLVIFTDGNGTYNWTYRTQLIQEIAKAAINAYLG